MTDLNHRFRKLSAVPVFLDNAVLWVTTRSDTARKYGLAGALLFFVAGLYWAIEGTPELGLKSVAPLLLLLLLSAPAGTLLNTIELHALSRIAGGPMTWRTSLELTVYTSAANMLPLPGGALAKLAGMKAHGVGYGTGSAMVLLSFLVWGGLAFLYSGAALILLGEARIAGFFGACGAVLLAICVVAFARFGQWRFVAVIAALRLAYFVLEAFRYMLALMTVGASISFLQGSALVVASFVGSAVVFAPQGLGVNEAAAAFLSTFVGVAAGLGFVAAAMIRIARLIGMALIAGAFLVVNRRFFATSGRNTHSGSV